MENRGDVSTCIAAKQDLSRYENKQYFKDIIHRVESSALGAIHILETSILNSGAVCAVLCLLLFCFLD